MSYNDKCGEEGVWRRAVKFKIGGQGRSSQEGDQVKPERGEVLSYMNIWEKSISSRLSKYKRVNMPVRFRKSLETRVAGMEWASGRVIGNKVRGSDHALWSAWKRTVERGVTPMRRKLWNNYCAWGRQDVVRMCWVHGIGKHQFWRLALTVPLRHQSLGHGESGVKWSDSRFLRR